MSRDEITDKKDDLLKEYNSIHAKSNKPKLLAKKEKRILGIDKDQGRAVLKYARISARKVKIVLDLIRYKRLDEAYAILKHTPKAASEILLKLLKSAESNAVNNNSLNKDSLFISEAYANQGPTLKRIRARAQGRAFRIMKRTSHITLVVRESE
jgi:large subunit ribosomal protein L22